MGVDARIITAGFELFIRVRFQNDPALRFFVQNHERRAIAELNCLKGVRECEIRLKNRFTKTQLEQLIAMAASLFCDFAKAAKEKQMMSAAELRRHEDKAGELQRTQEMVDDMAKEAMSTAITVPVPGLRDEREQEGQGHGDQMIT